MTKINDKIGQQDTVDALAPNEKAYGYSTTIEVHQQKASFGEITTKQRAFLELIGSEEKNKVIELREDAVTVGRGPDCGIQLRTKNVSRRHARIDFYNEEYHIEDLNSTNGTYLNGIKVVKCVLRNNDQIEIGGVRILFTEEKHVQQR